VFIGDVGLTGELKKVPSLETMIREIGRMGFKRIIVPCDSVKPELRQKLSAVHICEVHTVTEVIRIIFGDYKRKF